MDVSEIDPRLPFAADVYLGNGLRIATQGRSHDRRGGFVERVFLLAPDQFGSATEPLFREARAIIDQDEPQALEFARALRPDECVAWRERAILIAQGALARRIDVPRDTLSPVLHWNGGNLIVCVPTEIPSAAEVAAARVWISGFNETVCVRATRVKTLTAEHLGGARARIERMQSSGAELSVWRCELPSFCNTNFPIAVELAPNPTSFMHAMYIAHRGAAAIVVGQATGVGSTFDWDDEDASSWPRTRLLPSGWSYLKPDRSSGSSAPIFPLGAPAPINAVFLPDEALFRAIARATWTVTFPDALRMAFAD